MQAWGIKIKTKRIISFDLILLNEQLYIRIESLSQKDSNDFDAYHGLGGL